MGLKVILSANTFYSPEAGGHFWVFLNWALGLRDLECQVFWLEEINTSTPAQEVQDNLASLKHRLERYDQSICVALCSSTGEPLQMNLADDYLDINAIAEADLFLNMHYGINSNVVSRFRRSALIDIDPGLLQIWIAREQINVARHDVYFTTGETVGHPGALFPNAGIKWQYTPPCVSLSWWPLHQATTSAPFTTVSNWYENECVEDTNGWYLNNKRSGFIPFLDLPSLTTQPIELAIGYIEDEPAEVEMLQEKGWRIRDARAISSTPWEYQRYIQNSLGEFSCAKPSCIRLRNAWISDRTLCYLSSGKPAVVQHTGPSRFLPDASGLFRFQNLEEAVRYLEIASNDYGRQCKLARELAEEYFDSRKVVMRVLEQALA